MKDIEIPANRPYVILNAAMSLDGKISTFSGDTEFSDEIDWKRVHKLRADVDGILVGIGTIIKDDPKLRVKFYKGNPNRIVVDSKLKIPLESKVVTFEIDKYHTIIGTTEQAPNEKVEVLEKSGVEIIICGPGPQVNLVYFMEKLRNKGIRSILLEGGGTLNFSMFEQNLVDEIRISIAPVIVGGKTSTSLVDGGGFNKIKEAINLKLIKMEKLGRNLLLTYKIIK